jgi:hypothetical protein
MSLQGQLHSLQTHPSLLVTLYVERNFVAEFTASIALFRNSIHATDFPSLTEYKLLEGGEIIFPLSSA